MPYPVMQATFEVTYGPTTVRVWLDAKVMPSCFATELETAWAVKIESWLFERWTAVEPGDRHAKLSAQRSDLAVLFDQLAAIPGILAAQIVDNVPVCTVNSKRGFYVEYPTP